jgi:hypothetical protein
MLDYLVKNQEEDNLPQKVVLIILLLMVLVVELKVLMKITPLLLIPKLWPLGKTIIKLPLKLPLLYQDTVLLLPLEKEMPFFMEDIKSKLNVPLNAEDLDLVMLLMFKLHMLKYGIEWEH